MKIKLSHLRSLIREAAINMSSMSSKEEALAAVERFINQVVRSGDYGVVFETEAHGMQLIVGAYQASDEDHIEYKLFAPAMWRKRGRGLQPARWSQIFVEELEELKPEVMSELDRKAMSELKRKAHNQLDEF